MSKKIQDENGNTYVEMKPWYKKWWIWVLAVIVLFFIIGALGDNGDSNNHKSATSSTNSKTTPAKKDLSSSKVSAQVGTAVTLNAGDWKVGRDIQPGRYVIKANSGSGNLNDTSGEINVILGSSANNDLGQVDSYTTTLQKGDEIKLDGIQSTAFTPVTSRSYRTTLSAGNWEVGKDIAPGRYTIKALQGNGNLTSSNGEINQILGTSANSDLDQVTSFTTSLSRGEVLENDLESIQLIKQ